MSHLQFSTWKKLHLPLQSQSIKSILWLTYASSSSLKDMEKAESNDQEKSYKGGPLTTKEWHFQIIH